MATFKTQGEISTVGASMFTATAANTIVKSILFHNTTEYVISFTINCVPNNSGVVGTIDLTNQFFSYSLNSGDSLEWSFAMGYPMDINDSIQGTASATGLNYLIVGIIG